MKKSFVIGMFIALCAGFFGAPDASAQQAGAQQTDLQPLQGEVSGDTIMSGGIIDMEELVAKMDGEKETTAKVTGTVVDVCAKKGCWMTLQLPGDETMFVKFKDYGFFVPKDIQGREVVIEGTAFRDETSVKQLQHYARDAGKPEEEIAAITKPERELKFIATGVVVRPRK